VGAVSVLIFFAIMLTRSPGKDAGVEGEEARPSGRLLTSLATGLVPAVILGGILIKKSPQIIPLKAELPLHKLGEFLAGPYALAFELISVVLLVAMAGAVLLGFERRKGR
jgi:NADH-quinone oxidoreductase subunit J